MQLDKPRDSLLFKLYSSTTIAFELMFSSWVVVAHYHNNGWILPTDSETDYRFILFSWVTFRFTAPDTQLEEATRNTKRRRAALFGANNNVHMVFIQL